ncbi:hypothetical protein ACF0H5_010299 [Mactra antiquata]
MARLPEFQQPHLRSDVIKLLHDEVVSLCQRNFSFVSGLEIDGIICISVLDTKEQQVVKIHKTLKSVFAESAFKNKPRVDDYNAPSIWLRSDGESSRKMVDGRHRNTENYRDDIDALSNLLRDTNAAINEEERHKDGSRNNSLHRKSKRKCNNPQQRNIMNSNNVSGELDADKSKETIGNEQSVGLVLDKENNPESIACVNPFIQKEITVKEEKVDPEYDLAEQTHPKIVSVTSMSENTGTSMDNINLQPITRVSSLIERLIDKEIHQSNLNNESLATYSNRSNTNIDHQIAMKEDTPESQSIGCAEMDPGYKDVEVKVEKTVDGDGIIDDDDVCELPEVGGYRTEDNHTGSEDGRSDFTGPSGSLQESENNIGGADGDSYPSNNWQSSSEFQKQRKANKKSWIETVKDNVNKYQAALRRGTNTKKNGDSESCTPVVQTSSKVNSASGLVALLNKPTASVSRASSDCSTNYEILCQSLESGVPHTSKDCMNERSSSLSPVVKIEVDEEMSSEMYSQSDGEVESNWETQSETAQINQEKPGARPPEKKGKLVSRYPALFSHLRAKKVNYGEQDQSDSLVNRLPFISFNELFSTAATGSPLPKMNEAATMELLAKARIKPAGSKEKKPTYKKKTWNWKKRQVRPKDSNGKIIFPAQSKSNCSDTGVDGVSPFKKTPSKKVKKNDDNDAEWKPDSVAHLEDETDEPMGESSELDNDNGRTSRRTRLSCGEKPRINFAELENSDIEMDENDDYNDDLDDDDDIKQITIDPGPELSNPQSLVERFMGISSSQTGGVPSLHGSLNSDHYSISNSTSSSQCKCNICGLEFNQEYRLKYHMIKVHGVSEDGVKLFR